MRLVRVAMADARIIGEDSTERSGAKCSSASHMASSPQVSAASIWANELANDCAGFSPGNAWNSWNMPNSILPLIPLIFSPCVAAVLRSAGARGGATEDGRLTSGHAGVVVLYVGQPVAVHVVGHLDRAMPHELLQPL